MYNTFPLSNNLMDLSQAVANILQNSLSPFNTSNRFCNTGAFNNQFVNPAAVNPLLNTNACNPFFTQSAVSPITSPIFNPNAFRNCGTFINLGTYINLGTFINSPCRSPFPTPFF